MLHVPVVAHDARIIPLALRIDKQGIRSRKVHRVVHAQLLPLFELRRSVLRLPTIVVDQLVLGTRDVGNLEIRILDDVVKHAAVTSVGELPVPVYDEVFVLFLGDDITRKVAPVAVSLDAPVDNVPRLGQRVPVEVFPLIQAIPVEEQFPAGGDLRFAECVVAGTAGNGHGEQQRKAAHAGDFAAKSSW